MTRPVITHDPAVNFGRPMIGGAPVEAVCGRIWAGEPLDVVAEDHNISREQALVACWFAARYGLSDASSPWRRWNGWAATAEMSLWKALKPADYDTIPDPPARATK